jgi:hypothetical protein
MNKQLQRSAACAVVAAMLAGCQAGQTGPNGIPKITSVDPLTTGKLQFAVGTANLYGTSTGLNVVSTYRQSNGLSNVLVDTPTITGPFTLPASSTAGGFDVDPQTGAALDPYSTLYAGPSVEEVAAATGEITGTSQSVHPGTPACDSTTSCSDPSATGGNVNVAPNTSTFGQAGGVFVNGISPGNSTPDGTPVTNGFYNGYVPYKEPMYDSSMNVFTPFGGPPAFPGDKYGLGLRDGLFNVGSGAVGIPLGITTFNFVTVSPGTYTLSVQVPTGNNGDTESYGTVTATGSISSTSPVAAAGTGGLLGTITAPTLTLDSNGDGGGTITITSFPAGVTEELVEIVDFGDGDPTSGALNCQGATGSNLLPTYYTIEATAPGTYVLPPMIGPNTSTTSGASVITPSETICTAAANAAVSSTAPGGDNYTVQAIGADYPLFESLYPNNTSQTPTLLGPAGQADITISALTGATSMAHARLLKLEHSHNNARRVQVLHGRGFRT